MLFRSELGVIEPRHFEVARILPRQRRAQPPARADNYDSLHSVRRSEVRGRKSAKKVRAIENSDLRLLTADIRSQLFADFFALASLLHSSAHFRHASAHRENASIFECFSHALASSSQARAQTSQSG